MASRPRPIAAGSTPGPDAAGILGLALATTLGLQEIRVFLSDLVWVVGETVDRTVLGLMALGPFLAVGLAGVLLRAAGPRRGVALAAGWLGVSRLAEQASPNPAADLGLAAASVALWGWCLVGASVTMRRGVGLAVILGAALDLAIRLAYLTIDLPWTDHPTASVLVAVLAVGAFLGLSRAARKAQATGEARWGTLAPILGIGPWLALFLLVAGNPSQVMARTGLGFGAAAGALALGHAAGAQLVQGMALWPAMGRGLAVVGAGASLAWLPLWNGWPGGVVWAALGAAGAGLLVGGTLLPIERPALRPSATATALGLTAGLVLFVGITLAYYAFHGPGLLIGAAVAALMLSGLAGGAVPVREGQLAELRIGPAPAIGMLVLAVGTVRALSWWEPLPLGPAPAEITVMTYNLRAGFGSDNRWDLERIARTIEAESPDVVVLQEVSRGWAIAAGADGAVWLSQRLGMPLFFGGAAGDLHGNLLLARHRFEARAHRFSSFGPTGFPRGAIEAVLETSRGPLLILGTHLDRPEAAGDTRLAQVREMLGAAGGRRPAVVLGDLNAESTTAELEPLRAAGFLDAPAIVGLLEPTWPSDKPRRRIDHVFVSGQIEPVWARVVASDASDHRPVVTRLRVR